MAHLILNDAQFEAICERSGDFCGHRCRTCEAFQANQRYHYGGYDEDDENDDEDDGYGTHW